MKKKLFKKSGVKAALALYNYECVNSAGNVNCKNC